MSEEKHEYLASDIKQYEPLWGSWYIDEEIGKGAYGKVYKVHKEEFGKTYYAAVKMLSIPENQSEVERLRSEGVPEVTLPSYFRTCVVDINQEIDFMSMFKGNSNIVSIEEHKVIQKNAISWDILIRMELLSTLSSCMNVKPLSTQDVINLGLDISRALELCAIKNTIHRDIKPDNIFVSQFGEYKLGDFGVARQIERTQSNMSTKGTYSYMAPEVFKGEKYGASVDLYSLGIVMYRYLNNNRLPFLPPYPEPLTPHDREAALKRRMSGEKLPDIPDIDPELNAIVLKACAYDPADRFENATEFRIALEKFSGNESKPPEIVETRPEPKKNERKQRKVLRQEQDEMTSGMFNLRRNEPEAKSESESIPTVSPKVMNTLAIIGAVCCGLLSILSIFSGNRGDIFLSMPLYALCVAICFLNFRHSATNTILLVWLIGYLSISALNFTSFDYVLMTFALGLSGVESMRGNGKKFMNILGVTLIVCAVVYSIFVYISLGESDLLSFKVYMRSAFAIPFLMILTSCLLLTKRKNIIAGFIGLQLFSVIAFIMMIGSFMVSNSPSQVIFNVANACFVGFSPERFSWWRYARFVGLIIQTLGFESMLCLASARMIPSDFLEFAGNKKRNMIALSVCVLIMAVFLYCISIFGSV